MDKFVLTALVALVVVIAGFCIGVFGVAVKIPVIVHLAWIPEIVVIPFSIFCLWVIFGRG